jgi:hypothetical protein
VTLHVIALEPGDGCARRLAGTPFAERAILAEHRQRSLRLDELLRVAFLDHEPHAAMHDEVGVAPDR